MRTIALWEYLDDLLDLYRKNPLLQENDSFVYDLPNGLYCLLCFYSFEDGIEQIRIRPMFSINGTHIPLEKDGLADGECGLENEANFLIEAAWVIETKLLKA